MKKAKRGAAAELPERLRFALTITPDKVTELIRPIRAKNATNKKIRNRTAIPPHSFCRRTQNLGANSGGQLFRYGGANIVLFFSRVISFLSRARGAGRMAPIDFNLETICHLDRYLLACRISQPRFLDHREFVQWFYWNSLVWFIKRGLERLTRLRKPDGIFERHLWQS